MAKEQIISTKMSEKERGGGNFTIPPGAEFTITEAEFTTWEDAGEKALKGGRDASDPCLKLVADVEGREEPTTLHLGMGKSSRLIPSKDGDYLARAEGSSANGWPDGANGTIFLDSLTDSKKLGKKALDDDFMSAGASKALVGLKATAGSVIPVREGMEGKPKPTLIVEDILEAPGEEAAPKKGKPTAPAKGSARAAKEDEAADDEAASGGAGAGDGDANEETIETTVMDILENDPKYRKGLSAKDAWRAAYGRLKGTKGIDKLLDSTLGAEKWIGHRSRPWEVDGKGLLQTPSS